MSTAASGRQDAYIYDAVRTPFAKIGGALSGHRPDDLAALVVRSMVERAEGLDPESIDEVVFGNANGAGEENRNVARMATLLAGLPTSLPGTTVNRLCGSSLDAAMMASRQIEVDEADLMLVGGVESMSRAPWVLPKTERPFPMQDLHLANTTLGWRLVNPEMPDAWTVSLGEATEQLREKHGITREEQDVFSARSHQLAAKAWDEGLYDDLTVTVKANSKRGSDVTRDETVRADSTPETLGGLRTVFRKDNGTVTAGNASGINDGAAALVLAREDAARAAGLTPKFRILGYAHAGVRPEVMGIGPVPAVQNLLKRTGLKIEDFDVIESNEAFAAQALAVNKELGLDAAKVNPNGGAIALGHPVGATGAIITVKAMYELERIGGKKALITMCIGGGQGIALAIERI